MQNQKIELDSEYGKRIGFTSDKFDGYLWYLNPSELHLKPRVMISFIISKKPNKGNLSALFKAIEDDDCKVAVPTPFPLMESILRKKGFVMHEENDEVFGVVEVWEKES